MTTHRYTCILCPLSCQISLKEENNEIIEIHGNSCKLGEDYVTDEFRNPVRILTTTVRVEGGSLPVIPVRSEKPLPKHLIKKGVEIMSQITVKAPIVCGEVVIHNILGTGVNIVTMPGKTRRVGRRQIQTRSWKKAIVTLQTGDKIEFFEGV